MYGLYTGGFLAFIILLAVLEQVGVPNKVLGYLFVFFTLAVYAIIGIATAHGAGLRILRRRPARAGLLQRHGDRRGLDVGGLLRRHGGLAVPVRLRRPGLGARLDRRLRAGVDPGRSISAQVRRLHRARLHVVPVRRQLHALPRRDRAGVLLVHLCHGAGLRHRPDRLALPRHGLHGCGLRRACGHPGLLDAGRHARGDLDADRPVHRADHRLPDADRDPVDQEVRHSDPGADLRTGDPGHHGSRAGDAAHRPRVGRSPQAAHRALHQLQPAELLRHHLLHDGGHGLPAAHPDALLHDAERP